MKQKIIAILLTFSSALPGQERFPLPSKAQMIEQGAAVEELGKAEVLSLSYGGLAQFLFNRYWQGQNEDFSLYNSNPEYLSEEQASKPAIIFLHGFGSNQGDWIPMLESIEEDEKSSSSFGPVFTLNYEAETALQDLARKIRSIRELYLNSGVETVELYLVGHSLGGTIAAAYAFNPDGWVEGTTTTKVISIAGRLKNIEPPLETPLYAYSYDVLTRLDTIWAKIQENRHLAELYTIAAGEDWLIPEEVVLLGDSAKHRAIIPDNGHLFVVVSQAARQLVIKWLKIVP